MSRIINFVKREVTFSIAFLLTCFSIILNPNPASYLKMIDFRVLIILFSLMGISNALETSGAFNVLRDFLLKHCKSERSFAIVMTFLPFFTSALITNDVALIIFVPFTLALAANLIEKKKCAILIVLETIAANLGSMMLPVGNPQNLFLYSYYSFDVKTFFISILPYSILSGLLLLICTFFFFHNLLLLPSGQKPIKAIIMHSSIDKKKTGIFFTLLLFSLLTVFRVVSPYILLLVAVLSFLLFSRESIFKVDYILLLTFVCFFLFSGNLSANEWIKTFFTSIINRSAFTVSLLTSQVISNVPSAVLLSQFTNDKVALLQGTNIGGLGTPIASLASLITIKAYMKEEGGDKKSFFIYFFILNILFLALLCLFKIILKLI